MLKKHIKNNIGLSLVEVVLGIAIFSIVIFGFLRFYIQNQQNIVAQTNRVNIENIGRAIIKTAEIFIDTYTPFCIPTDALTTTHNLNWGWRHPNCNRVTIFPNLSNSTGFLVLTYNLNTSTLPVTTLNTLFTQIRESFHPCNVTLDTPNQQINVSCPFIVNARYCLSDTNCNLTSLHTGGNSYNYIDHRISGIAFEYNEVLQQVIEHRIGFTDHRAPLYVDFSDFYRIRESRNQKKFLDLYNTVKKYEVSKRLTEAQATIPNGMSINDDYWVPWIFQITASNKTNAYVTCNNSNCSNLHNSNFWNNATMSGSQRTNMYFYLRNIINYLLGGDTSYYVDAYGNSLGIELLVTMNCLRLYSPVDTTNSNNCNRLNSLFYPQQQYYNTLPSDVKPPYIGYIYSEFCWDLSRREYDYRCRIPVVYSN